MTGFALAFGVFMLFAGLYLLISGIVGKGAVYGNDNIPASKKKKYRTFVRVMCIVSGLLLVLFFSVTAINYFKFYGLARLTDAQVQQYDMLAAIGKATLAVSLAAIAGMIFVSSAMSAKSDIVSSESDSEGKLTSSAFDFENKEEKSNERKTDNKHK